MQEVIDNLMISAIQYRSETDPDIQPHVHQRCVDERVVQPTREVDYCKQTLIHVLQDVLTSLARMQVAVLALEDSSKLGWLAWYRQALLQCAVRLQHVSTKLQAATVVQLASCYLRTMRI